MKHMTIDMPIVSECLASECAYNVDMNCHAKAITVGNSLHAGCDTFFSGSGHTRATTRTAGIGACKSTNCAFNEDLECMTDSIRVAPAGQAVNCMTYSPR
ncbi:DUF1540 domain-containing protein [Thiobacillus denitrificans]|nr:DUF1540 domain-containing protein [Thiobacillus denitrificans]